MADIYALMQEIIESDEPMNLARNPNIQFGREGRRYLGATLLPARNTENQFSEDKIIYKTIVANDATRYSEPQLKNGELVGSFDVKLGELDIARQLTGRDFDNIRKVAMDNPERARQQLMRWLNEAVNLALEEKREVQRWQAIVNAQVQIIGTEGKSNSVIISNPSGHRITIPSGTVGAPAGWYDKTGNYDPFDDIFAGRNFLRDKGYDVGRIITSTQVFSVLSQNPAVKQRVGMTTINSSGQLMTRSGSASFDMINSEMRSSSGLAAIETYDTKYSTQAGNAPFLPQNAFVMLATTLRNEEIDLGDQGYRTVSNVLGYHAVGYAVGESAPGRIIRSTSSNMKPVGWYAQGFETSFPVITEPEAVFVIFVNPPSS